MSLPPRVSVIMTVYNGERFIADAIQSILKQTYRDFELLIVDDGSNDNTPEILRSAQENPRVVVISRPHIGRVRALSVALQHARGVYIAIMDADDLSKPDRLAKQLAFLQEHPQVGALGGCEQLMYEDGRADRVLHVPLTDLELRRMLVRRNPMIHTSVMMPRAVLMEVGGYNESFWFSHDYELWIRIAQRYQLANLPDVLVVERDHGEAFFRNRIPTWQRLKTRTELRFKAWRQFSRNPLELWFVIDPIDAAIWILRDKCPPLRRLYHALARRRDEVTSRR